MSACPTCHRLLRSAGVHICVPGLRSSAPAPKPAEPSPRPLPGPQHISRFTFPRGHVLAGIWPPRNQ